MLVQLSGEGVLDRTAASFEATTEGVPFLGYCHEGQDAVAVAGRKVGAGALPTRRHSSVRKK